MSIEVYIDGLCEGLNPGGVACYGVVFKGDFEAEMCGTIGSGPEMSNNVAEFSALVKALSVLLPHSKKTIKIYSDSQLLVNIMSGRWQPREGLYIPYCQKAFELLKYFDDVTFQWIPREDNVEADALSRKAYESYCEAHGMKPVYEAYKRLRRRPRKPSETCLNCRWVGFSGPHIGCFYGGKWRRWLPKKFARTSRCPHYERRVEEVSE